MIRPRSRAVSRLPRLAALGAFVALPAFLGLGPHGVDGLPGGEGVAHAAALRDDRLAAFAAQALRGDGVEAQVALRRLWLAWSEEDPDAVEAHVEAVESGARSAPLRAYAGMLRAYARRYRGDLDGAKARIAKLGYVDRWLVAGPFDNEGKAGLDAKFGPEADAAEPLSLATSYPGKERPVVFRPVPEGAFPYGWLDLGALVRPSENACSYASTFVRDRRPSGPPRRIGVSLGAAGAVAVFWNGQLAYKDPKYRALDADRVLVPVYLRPGPNRLTVKVCGDEGGAMLALRLADERGAPDPEVEATVDAKFAKDAAAQAFKKDRGRGADGAPSGFLPKADALAARGDAGSLETAARWLVTTHADDPAELRARELARRAAERGPTVPRLLLAGELAEDRNQRAVWLDRADDLARRGQATRDDRVQALVARAEHVRSGPVPGDALPFVRQALALDPDDANAVVLHANLLADVGLKETALAELKRALARAPRSLLLLLSTQLQLRELDRVTEEAELAERAQALRFDDAGALRERLELEVARRDGAAAKRWADRAVAAHPADASTLAAAARAYVRLGDPNKAIALHKRALELAPEDVESLRRLADVHALAGQRDEQLRLLRKVVELRPQAKDVREYLAHAEPGKPRDDEAYAVPAKDFLARRGDAAKGHGKRTLVDLQVTTVFPNGLASRFHQVVFQPLTESAAAEAREYAFGYEADTETVQLRGAKVHKKSGAVEEAVESGEGHADNAAMAMYTSGRTFYVHFPRLEPGDVVELLYRVEDIAPRNAFADYFGEVAYLQGTEPLHHAEYVLVTPKSRAFVFNEPKVPGLKTTVVEKGATRVHRFVAKDVPPLEVEPHQPPLSELLGHVHVSTYKNWDDMGRWYWGLVRDQFVADDEVKKRVAEITKGLTDERAKVRAVYEYVVQRTRYVALEFGIHGFKPYRCAQIFARGFGDCKDKATLIVTMLKELGIPATIVIVRTGMRGDFGDKPASLAPFDHAIAYVPSMDLYLDGTAEFTGSEELPTMDRNSLALQVNEGKPKLVRLPDAPAAASVTKKRVELKIADSGDGQVDWALDVRGAFAPGYRARYHADATRAQRVREDVSAELPRIEIDKVTAASDLDDIEAPVRISARGAVHELARREGDLRSVAVGPSPWLVREYASLSTRRQDVRLSARATNETETVLTLPAGAKIVRVPEARKGESPFGSYALDVESAGGKITVTTRLVIDRSRVKPAEYAAFRSFCEAADRALGQRVTFQPAR